MPPITVCSPQRYRVEFHYINVNDCLSNCQSWIVPHSSQDYGLLPYCRLRLPPQSHYMCRSFRPHPLDSINRRPILRNHSHFQLFVRYLRYTFLSAFRLLLSTVHCFDISISKERSFTATFGKDCTRFLSVWRVLARNSNNDTHPTVGSRTLLFPDIVCSIADYAIVGIFAKMIFRLVLVKGNSPRSEATCKQITWPKANLQVQDHLHRCLLYDLYIGRWTATPARRPADQAGVYLLIVVVAMTRLIHCLTSINLTYYCELAICQGVSFNFSLPPGQAGRK